MNRPASILLIVLLLGSVAFGVYQYTENMRLTHENMQTKSALDKISSQLRITQQELNETQHERIQLQIELNQTRQENAELQKKTRELEANITALEQSLQDKALRDGAITVPLSFFWNRDLALAISVTWISAVINRMNEVIWADFKVYFFIYHAEPQTFMPKTSDCHQQASWALRASEVYQARDIPIGVFMDVGSGYAGCAMWGQLSYISISVEYFNPIEVIYGSQLLSHELLHAMCQVSDSRINSEMGLGAKDYIPWSWREMIQTHATWFSLPIPSS